VSARSLTASRAGGRGSTRDGPGRGTVRASPQTASAQPAALLLHAAGARADLRDVGDAPHAYVLTDWTAKSTKLYPSESAALGAAGTSPEGHDWTVWHAPAWGSPGPVVALGRGPHVFSPGSLTACHGPMTEASSGAPAVVAIREWLALDREARAVADAVLLSSDEVPAAQRDEAVGLLLRVADAAKACAEALSHHRPLPD